MFDLFLWSMCRQCHLWASCYGLLPVTDEVVTCKTGKYFCPLIVFISRNFHHCIISCFYRDSSWARHLFVLRELFNTHVPYVFDNQPKWISNAILWFIISAVYILNHRYFGIQSCSLRRRKIPLYYTFTHLEEKKSTRSLFTNTRFEFSRSRVFCAKRRSMVCVQCPR